MSRRVRSFCIVALAVIAACGGSDSTAPGGGSAPTPASIVITPVTPAPIPARGAVQLSVMVYDASHQAMGGQPVQYLSADTAIATVSSSGLATSVGPVGVARITARTGSL